MALTDKDGNELSVLKGNPVDHQIYGAPGRPYGAPGQPGGPPVAAARQVRVWDGKNTALLAGTESYPGNDAASSEPSAFRRFEYDIIPWKDDGGLSGMIAFLNEKGADGWEAFYIVTGGQSQTELRHFVHFKRELA